MVVAAPLKVQSQQHQVRSYVFICYSKLCYVLSCQILSHYFCDVVPSYVTFMVYYVISCKTATGKRETNRHGRTKDPSPRFFWSRASLLQRVFSKPIMRAFCLQMGGGTAPRPQPNRFFKPCEVALKHLFETHHTCIVFANAVRGGGGGLPPPPKPPAALNFKACKLASKYISLLFRNLSCDHCVWDVL